MPTRTARRPAARSPAASVFRAIADPGRRAILDQLARDGDSPALGLSQRMHSSQPALSKHLRVLREARLVVVQRRGRQQIYSLNAAPLRAIDRWIDLYRQFWQQRLDALGRHLDGGT